MRELMVKRHIFEASLTMGRDDLGHGQARWGAPGHQARPRRGTDRRRGVAIGRTDTAPRQRIQMRGFVKGRTITTEVAAAQVVDGHENNVRSWHTRNVNGHGWVRIGAKFRDDVHKTAICDR